jgi:NAD(P)-dependent dehydrogenase (short-subunit alcohol dehydrogenase family)
VHPNALTRIADSALDRTVIGYSALGYAARHAWWAPDPRPGALIGKTAIVTGAKGGLGKATAIGLARLGAGVRIVVRDARGGRAAAEDIERAVPGAQIVIDECDVSLLSDVRGYVAGIGEPIHILIHNAGVMPSERRETAEGNELMLATHVLGPHLMTRLLIPKLTQGAPSRVIWISSGGMYGQRLRIDDLQYRGSRYRPATGYARTKRMQVVLASEWAEHESEAGITFHSMHPGWADTPGLAAGLPRFRALTRPLLRTPEQGADTVVWLAASEQAPKSAGSSAFWHDRAIRPTHYLPTTRETSADRAELWNACQRMTAAARD